MNTFSMIMVPILTIVLLVVFVGFASNQWYIYYK